MDDAPSAHERPTGVAGRTVAALCFTELAALGCLVVPQAIGLALKVTSLDLRHSPETTLSIVVGCGAVVAMVSNPVFGWLSDRSPRTDRSRWIFGGVVAGAICAPSVLLIDSVVGLTIYWCAMQAAYNATFANLYGTIADVVPEHDRARVAGLFSAAAGGAVVLPLALVAVLPKVPVITFVLIPFVAVPVAFVAFLHLRRDAPRRPAARRREEGVGAVLAASRQYWLVWSQRLFAQIAHALVLMFGVFFLVRRVGLEEDHAATWVTLTVALAALLSMATSIIGGRFASRTGNYGPYVVAALASLIVALAIKAVAATVAAFVVATLLVGLGIGCYYAVDLALVLRTVPAQHAATLLGFFNIARTLPQSLAPALAPALLAIGSGDLVGVDRSQNYFALYTGGLVVALVALLLVVPITVLRRDVVET